MTTPIPPTVLEAATTGLARYIANLEGCSLQLTEFFYEEAAEAVLRAVNIAHLQAAADALPGLVAALESAYNWMEAACLLAEGFDGGLAVHEQMRQALAKAKGGAQ